MTLVEALGALCIAAILVAGAVPLCRELVLDSRMTAAVNGFVHCVHLARQAASVEQRQVTICRSVNGVQCDDGGDWASGWLVFVNRDGDDPPVVDSGERVLAVAKPVRLGSITSNRRAYVLRPFDRRGTNGTAVFCDERGSAAARAVIVSYTGRPRIARRAADGRPLACPG